LCEIDAIEIDQGVEGMYAAQAVGRIVAMNKLVDSAVHDTVKLKKTLLGKICETREPCWPGIE